jgi:hypothetical protein
MEKETFTTPDKQTDYSASSETSFRSEKDSPDGGDLCKRPRPPVIDTITKSFKNALVINPTLSKLSQKAQQLIIQLLSEIDDRHEREIINLTSHDGFAEAAESLDQHPPPKDSSEQSTQTDELPHPIVDHIITHLQEMNTKIHQLNESFTTKPGTYAAAVATPSSTLTMPKSTLIIKPQNMQSPGEINKVAVDLQKLPCPKNIKIQKLKINNNVLEVRADSEASKESLKNLLTSSKLSTDITVEDKRPSSSKVIIFNLSPDTEIEELKSALQSRLNFNCDLMFDIIRKLASKREGLEHWVITLPRRAALQLLATNHFFLGFQRTFYKRYHHVTRCTRCQRLNDHTTSTCTSARHFCSSCGENHHFTACTQKIPRCVNCHEFNHHIKKSATSNDDPVLQQLLDDCHSASSSDCPSYLYYLECQKAQK